MRKASTNWAFPLLNHSNFSLGSFAEIPTLISSLPRCLRTWQEFGDAFTSVEKSVMLSCQTGFRVTVLNEYRRKIIHIKIRPHLNELRSQSAFVPKGGLAVRVILSLLVPGIKGSLM